MKRIEYKKGDLINGFYFISDIKSDSKERKGRFECKHCSTIFISVIQDIKTGHTTSCGCFKKELLIKRNFIHGGSKSSEYKSWLKMKERCYDKKNNRYSSYGGKGVIVCERWQKFENFLEDMGKKPLSTYTIDRIDINKNYEPSNCRWATKTEQNRNRTSTIYLEIKGIKKSFLDWVDELGLHGREETIRGRLRYGWSPEKALGLIN